MMEITTKKKTSPGRLITSKVVQDHLLSGRTLNLRGTPFTGFSPDGIQYLLEVKVQTLVLHESAVQRLPLELAMLDSLKTISLGNAPLASSDVQEFVEVFLGEQVEPQRSPAPKGVTIHHYSRDGRTIVTH